MLIHLKSCFLPRCAKDAPVGVFTDGKVIDAALDSMHELSKSNSKPWFLAVGLNKSHLKLAIPLRFLHMQVPVGDFVTVPSFCWRIGALGWTAVYVGSGELGTCSLSFVHLQRQPSKEVSGLLLKPQGHGC